MRLYQCQSILEELLITCKFIIFKITCSKCPFTRISQFHFRVLMGMKWPIKSVSGLERVKYMEKILTDVKSSTVPVIGSLLAGTIGLIPTSIRRVFLFKFFLAGGSAVVSCFPPTPDTIYLDGVKVHDLISCVGSLGQLSKLGHIFL